LRDINALFYMAALAHAWQTAATGHKYHRFSGLFYLEFGISDTSISQQPLKLTSVLLAAGVYQEESVSIRNRRAESTSQKRTIKATNVLLADCYSKVNTNDR
jgi:hypothetical protein